MASRPRQVALKAQLFGLDLHPSEEIVAAGLITGAVHTFSYAGEGRMRRLLRAKPHKGSCRALRFSPGGDELYTCGADHALCVTDVSTGAVSWKRADAHAAAVNALSLVRGRGVATGDDDGCVRVWDTRTREPVMAFEEQEDYITDICYAQEKNDALLVTSGDGTFGWYDLRKQALGALSDNLEDELLCVGLMKGGKKVLCGSQGGVLNVFSYGDFGDISDRHPGHPGSIDTLAVLNDDVLCTGASDGYIRMVQVQPWRLVHVLGSHDGAPIESVRLSASKQLLASCGHDMTLRLWDLQTIVEEGGHVSARALSAAGSLGERGREAGDGADDDADSDDDSEEEAERRKKKRKRSAAAEMRVPEQQPGRAVRLDASFTAGL